MLQTIKFAVVIILCWLAIESSPVQALQDRTKAELAPNAPKKNRESLSVFLKESIIEQAGSKRFSASGQEEIRVKEEIKFKTPFGNETIKIDTKLGEAKATLNASLNDPVKNLSVSIPELRRKGDLEVSGKCKTTCPFKGNVDGKVLGVPIKLGFSAVANLEVAADVKFATGKGGKLKLTPKFTDWKGAVSNVRFEHPIADAVFAKLANRLANEWLEQNKTTLVNDANAAIQKAALKGKLTVNTNELFE